MFRISITMSLILVWTQWANPAIFAQTDRSSAGDIELGVISRKSGSQIISLFVVSPETRLQDLLRQAFSLHGGYLPQRPEKADFTFRFTPVGDSVVRLDIESGQPAEVLFSHEVPGDDLTKAALMGNSFYRCHCLIDGFF